VGNSTKLKFEHFRPFSDFIWFFCLLHLSVLAFLLGARERRKMRQVRVLGLDRKMEQETGEQ
jgi:hypothetical protein